VDLSLHRPAQRRSRDGQPGRLFPVCSEPAGGLTAGTKFTYNSGISLMLGEIIHKVSGLPADKFAERYLFEPLGIFKLFLANSAQRRREYPGRPCIATA